LMGLSRRVLGWTAPTGDEVSSGGCPVSLVEACVGQFDDGSRVGLCVWVLVCNLRGENSYLPTT
jgi:hypothetical protein